MIETKLKVSEDGEHYGQMGSIKLVEKGKYTENIPWAYPVPTDGVYETLAVAGLFHDVIFLKHGYNSIDNLNNVLLKKQGLKTKLTEVGIMHSTFAGTPLSAIEDAIEENFEQNDSGYYFQLSRPKAARGGWLPGQLVKVYTWDLQPWEKEKKSEGATVPTKNKALWEDILETLGQYK